MANPSLLKNLTLLWWLRSVAMIGQWITIIVVQYVLLIKLPITPLCCIFILLLGINIWTKWRIKTGAYISEHEFFCQLVMDIAALAGVLYLTGGAANPFASLFILQVIIAAIALPAFYTWIAAGITITAYTLLLFFKIDLPGLHHHNGEFFNLHIYGMWLSFALLAIIVGWFVVRINGIIRKQDTLLAQAEKMTAMGIFAAGAVHEFGTPLSTLMILAEEYSAPLAQEERERKGKIFVEQLARCRNILSRITVAGGVMRAESGTPVILKEFLSKTLQYWHQGRTSLMFEYSIDGDGSVRVVIDEGFRQAIINMLDNAADASPTWVKCEVLWTQSCLVIQIHDKGKGILPEIQQKLGEIGTTTKPEGLGMGIFLAKMVVNRLNGALTIENNLKGGTVVTIELPLKEIRL